MSLFNFKRKSKERVTNRAGGAAFKLSVKQQLATLLITSLAQDQFYRSKDQSFAELIQLLPQVDPVFAAKAAIYARKEFGMRSISHVLAAELAAYASGQAWAKGFYKNIVKRPDDMLEIIAYFKAKGGKTLPNAMKKGFSQAFDQFDSYQLSKYRGERKAVKLVDIVNLVHPIPRPRNAAALQALVKGELRNVNTWESQLTQAGQRATTEQDKSRQKTAVWTELLRTGKLGYFALLRNLRNIAEQAPELTPLVTQQLTNLQHIKRSLVLPFRFLTAIEVIEQTQLPQKRQLLTALHQALELSLSNVPRFAGRTLVVLDDSGSMTWGNQKQQGATPIRIGALFAAMLYKSNHADLMRFSDDATYLQPYFGDAAMSIADRLIKQAKSAGTNFHAIFETANQAYDRIIILSDMQGWIGQHAPVKAFETYQQRFGVKPYVYSFDLSGYGSLQLPAAKTFCLAGFSDKVFDIMALLETDHQALVNQIEAMNL